MEKRDSGAAPLCRGSFEVFYASEHLHAPMTKRSAEHSVSREENGFEIARTERARGWVFQEVWRSGMRNHSNCVKTRFGRNKIYSIWTRDRKNLCLSVLYSLRGDTFQRGRQFVQPFDHYWGLDAIAQADETYAGVLGGDVVDLAVANINR